VADPSQITDFWNERACGEVYAQGDTLLGRLRQQEAARYRLEPYIFEFAKFHEARNKDILEVGVGMGADFLQFARQNPRHLVGIDASYRAVEFTQNRLSMEGFSADVRVADAEQLPFKQGAFDMVYSWGVLHHSCNPDRAIDEIMRVLRPGGCARIMIYHKYSIVGLALWIKYGLGRKSLSQVYAQHLESPGTHAYSVREARRLFWFFSEASIVTRLSVGDLMEGQAGQRHQGLALTLARRIWPRWLIRMFPGLGLFMLIEAKK